MLSIIHTETNKGEKLSGDTLYLDLAVSKVLVSAALFKENENWKQIPVLFIRKSLSEA